MNEPLTRAFKELREERRRLLEKVEFIDTVFATMKKLGYGSDGSLPKQKRYISAAGRRCIIACREVKPLFPNFLPPLSNFVLPLRVFRRFVH
jgi:hypothetical protein